MLSLTFILSLFVLTGSRVLAHPLGNFSINRYARVHIDGASAEITIFYVVDMAEIPTYQARTQMDADGDGEISTGESRDFLAQNMAQVGENLRLTLDGVPLPLTLLAPRITFPEGNAGLPTTRLEARFVAELPATNTSYRLTLHDDNYADRMGWQEIIATPGQAVQIVETNVPATDISQALTAYPDDLLQTPLLTNSAELVFAMGASAVEAGLASSVPAGESPAGLTAGLRAGLSAGSFATVRDPFTELINLPELGMGGMLLALLAAFGWGAAHALSPGHGKSIAGAYLVGSRGTPRHALFLGLTTTVTHTVGVFVLGLVTLFAAQYILPETLYPWLSVFSGLLVVVIGISIFRGYWRGLFAKRAADQHKHDHHGHAHDHDHDHAHDHGHDHGPHGHSHMPPGSAGEPITWRGLLALGISGGIVPCPSALVLMLGAIALGRVAFGLVLITAFSLGLACVLTVVGILLLHARQLFARIPESGRLLRYAPVASALFIIIIGVGITTRAFFEIGIL